MIITGYILDPLHRRKYSGTIRIENGKITSITEHDVPLDAPTILPGFVDAHVHIESSMLVPSEFARIAVVHGSVGTISDPHEIANVLGLDGVRFMLRNGQTTPFKFVFGAPSCVPATLYETAGAVLTHDDIAELFDVDGLAYLSEMMNFPGVIFNDESVHAKLTVARERNRPIDGHAPGLTGEKAQLYANAGISTDHECCTLEEAIEKIQLGMKILIREGSAAKSFDALHPLFSLHPESIMLCSDDKHPNDLVEGHINLLVKRALTHGYDVFDVLRAASVLPVLHYRLHSSQQKDVSHSAPEIGLLQVGDSADFIVIDSLSSFRILKTFINGICVAENGVSHVPRASLSETPNFFSCTATTPDDFALAANTGTHIRVIEALDGQLITNEIVMPISEDMISGNTLQSDVERDILKIAVVNRYQTHKAEEQHSDIRPAVAFVKNIGLRSGAVASCVAHDCHNIIVVGVSDQDIATAVNAIIEHRGGISVVDENGTAHVLPLPVAGIMSADDGHYVAKAYTNLDALAKKLGTTLSAPFMTISFLALLVIPKLKLSDQGLFNGESFTFTDVTCG